MTAQPLLTDIISLHAHVIRLPSGGNCCHQYLTVVMSTEGWFYCCCHWEEIYISCKMNRQQRFLRIKKCQHNIKVGTATHLGSYPFKKPVQWAWHRGDRVHPLDRLRPSLAGPRRIQLGWAAAPPISRRRSHRKKMLMLPNLLHFMLHVGTSSLSLSHPKDLSFTPLRHSFHFF